MTVKKTAGKTAAKEFDGTPADAFLNLAIVRADGTSMRLEKGLPLYNTIAKDAGVIAWGKANQGKTLTLNATVHVVGQEAAVEKDFDFA